MSVRHLRVLETGQLVSESARDKTLIALYEWLHRQAAGTQLARAPHQLAAEELGCGKRAIGYLLERLRELGRIVATVKTEGRFGERAENIYCLAGPVPVEELIERANTLAQQTLERAKRVFRQVMVVEPIRRIVDTVKLGAEFVTARGKMERLDAVTAANAILRHRPSLDHYPDDCDACVAART